MSIIAALAVVSMCSWDNPGANRYRGKVPEAVQRYADIPQPVRDKLQTRMEKRLYDEVVDIKKDSISGKHEYTDLRDMHFGGGQVCRQVSMNKWKPDMVERGLVYCEAEHCIIVPTVCNNVSRVTRIKKMQPPPGPAPTEGGGLVGPVEVLEGGGGFVGVLPPVVEYGAVSFEPRALPPPPVSFSGDSAIWFPPPIDRGGFFPPPPQIEPVVPVIPEPSTLALVLMGLAAVIYKVRRF